MARNPKVELRGHEGQVVHPITDGDCVIFPSGETLSHKLSEQEEVMYAPEVTNSSPMFKVGEGDSSDYSANVLDGAYQEAVLKGQTYVNTIQEPSADVITLPTPFTEYERTQSKTFTEMQDGTFGLNLVGQSYVNCIQEPSEPSYVALGENLEFQNKKVEYTTDGQIKSAMLNGMTLVNLATITKTKASGEITSAKALINLNFNKSIFVPNKSYTIKIELKINSNTNTRIYYELFGRTSEGASVSASGNIVADDNMVGTIYVNKYIKNILPLADAEKYSVDLYIAGRPIDTTLSCSYDIEVLSALFIEGDHTQEDIPYFQGMQSVTMTTELENVCSRYNSSGAKNGKTFTVGTANDRRMILSDSSNIAKYGFKQNMKYLMQFKITNLNLDGEEYIELIFSDSNVSSGDALFGDYASTAVKITKNGIYRTVLTTSTVIDTSVFIIKGLAEQWEGTSSTSRTLTISQIMCIEYQNGMENWDLPYFETTQLMKPVQVESTNKNLFDGQLESGNIDINTGAYAGSAERQRTVNFIPVKPNTTYILSNNREVTFGVREYDNNKNYLGWYTPSTSSDTLTALVVTKNSNVAFLKFVIVDTNTDNQIQLEEGSTSTDYVPHQSKTTSALEPITLRAIGNVKDTLDLSTGEYIQRIGEIVLDGSENWGASNVISKRYSLDLYATMNAVIDKTKILCICDKIQSITTNQSDDDKMLGITITNGNRVMINTNYDTINEFKNWLSQNPIKVQYELANHITRKISLEYPNLQTYANITHVQSIAMDGTLIPKIFLPSDISYKTMLKPNTSYNVIVDREVIDSTNQLTVNLGGTTANITANRTVVTTPSTLSNETLTFSGKDNRLAKAMLIEGSTLINGDLPHFDGIGDVKLGRVVENLCMANEYPEGNGRTTDTYSNNSITSKFTASGSRVYLFDLIKPIQNGKKYFVYAPCSQTCAIGFKTIYNGASLFSVARTNITNYAILSVDNEILRECQLFIGQLGAMPVNTTMTIRRPIICEYIDGMENWDWESIGYFTGTRNIGNEFMRIGNKNLFDGKIELGGYTGTTGEPYNANDRVRSIKKTYLKPGVYYLSSDNATAVAFGIFNIDGTFRQEHANTSGDRLKLVLEQEAYTHITVINPDLLNAKIQLEEASSATSYVAHKHNSLHILPNEQIPLTFVQGRIDYTNGGSWANAINNTATQVIRTDLLDLEPNETYRVSCGNSDFMFAVGLYNNSLLGSSVISYTSDRERYITTTKDVYKIGIATMRKNSTNITPSVLHQVRLEKVTDVTLRGFGGVRDELDLTRGVYIQRIKEITLNGKEQWKLCTSAYQPTDTNYINYDLEIDNIKLSAPILCDSIKTRDWNISSIEFNSRSIAGHSTNRILRLCIEKTIAPDVETLKTYLSTNMVKVQYQLRTPIEHKINIPMKNELNQTIAKPNGIFTLPLMYSETNHVDINSQIYPKVQSRDYISYPVIANNSQLHTVFHNKLGTGNLTVNLCGTSVTSVDGTSKCTITTPSTISQYELRLSGARNKVSNVCVFSGDYMNVNVPYVEGMMNAVNPIVKNVGKNLLPNNNFYEKMFSQDKDGVRIINQSNRGWCHMFHNNIAIPLRRGTYIYTSQLVRGTFNGGTTKFIFSDGTEAGEFWNYSNGQKTTHKIVLEKDKVLTGVCMWNPTGDFVIQLQLEESSTPSQYELYKENILKTSWSIGYNAMIKGKSISSANGTSINNALNRYRTDFIKIDFAKIYINSNNPYCLFLYDINKKYLGRFTDSWVTDRVFEFNESNAYYFIVVFNTDDGEDTTTYISSKETRITLRSLPNGVRDELNLQTGEYIQRIGEVVLDGSEKDYTISWPYDGEDNTNTTCRFDIKNSTIKNVTETYGNMNCDRLPWRMIWSTTKGIEGCYVAKNENRIVVRMKKDRFETLNPTNVNKYFKKNPMTIQFELTTPIIKHIDIHNYPHSYKDGHVVIESNDPSTNVTAQLIYQCVANRTGQIQEHTEQIEKQEHEINELEMLILENIRQQQNR